jgi:hypothetical protein
VNSDDPIKRIPIKDLMSEDSAHDLATWMVGHNRRGRVTSAPVDPVSPARERTGLDPAKYAVHSFRARHRTGGDWPRI